MTKGPDRYTRASALLAAGHSHSAVADEFGVTERTVRRWVADGKVTADVEPPADDGEVSLAEARRRKETALAELRELQVRQQRGELLDAEAVAAGQRETAHRVKTAFLAWPGQVSASLAADLGVDPGPVGAALEGHVRRLLEEMADMFADEADQAEDEAA